MDNKKILIGRKGIFLEVSVIDVTGKTNGKYDAVILNEEVTIYRLRKELPMLLDSDIRILVGAGGIMKE